MGRSGLWAGKAENTRTVTRPCGAKVAISYSSIPNHVTSADSIIASVTVPYTPSLKGTAVALLLDRAMYLSSSGRYEHQFPRGRYNRYERYGNYWIIVGCTRHQHALSR